ncbi:hypothetical protein HHK36_004239 [Tetracentron sinense]|uniref:Trichome birefringence-like N-terminal domain-containing protein n=1 Tax=Tetracentron sinense TaxID=13715 RepID=A0A835CWH8_TETSI|nr:hypothetical protein HHK36_033000 [Tetracentron sinense]KAF8411681.1 hypothetical protein HHK36_004239 [Tetracentron sinense]
MVSSFNRSMSGHFGRRGSSLGSPKVVGHKKSWISPSFHVLVVIGSLVSFILAIGCGYHFVFPSLSQALHGHRISKFVNSTGSCDVFKGRWVRDDGYPLYNGSGCPFLERGFNCLANGRKDRDYLRWRWKPNNCDIPRFNVQDVLERLRGKRVVFVGDSMSRTQWESLICLLMSGVEDKKSIYEVNRNKITKRIRFLGVRFSSFNFTVEYFRSVFLVQNGLGPKNGPKRVKSTLKLDKLVGISKEWIDSDVLIFNTGHWWTPGKLFEMYLQMNLNYELMMDTAKHSGYRGCYFQVGRSLKLGMSTTTAFRTAVDTWASWVETMVNTNRTRVFFRTFEPSHWSDRNRRFCKVTRNPMSVTRGRDQSPFSDIISKVVKNMTVPATVLHVTSMSAFRSDAHVGTWSDTPSVPDCSHWCLPGVPDVWNEIVFSHLLANNGLPLQ